MSSGCWDPVSCWEQLCSSLRLFSWKQRERCEDALRYLCFRMEMEPAVLVGVFSHPERHDFWGQFGPGATSSIPSGPPSRVAQPQCAGLPVSRFSQRSSSSLGSSSWAEGTGTVPPHQLSWGCHCLAHGSPGPAGPPHCLLGLCHHAWTPNSGFKGRTQVSASLPKCPFCGTSVSPQGQEAGRPMSQGPCPAVQGSSRSGSSAPSILLIIIITFLCSALPCPGTHQRCPRLVQSVRGPPRELPAGTV